MQRRRLIALFVGAGLTALAAPRPSGANRPAAPPRAPRPHERPRPSPSDEGRVCTARLIVRQTTGAAGCFIDERVTGAPGVLRYPCGGGPATAAFRNGTFVGSVEASGAVSLTLQTSFHYSDGCNWRSAQSITGSLTDGLRFQYGETPVPGQRGCARSCHAGGDVEVQR